MQPHDDVYVDIALREVFPQVWTPVDIPAPVAIAVTLELAGGVPAPTGAKYLVGVVN